MPTSRVLILAGAGLLASAGVADAASPFVAAGASPSPLAAPGSADFRFTIAGGASGTSTEFLAVPVDAKKSAFGGAAPSVDVTGARAEGGTLTEVSTAIASMAPTCRRGTAFEDRWTKYRIDVPANATATVIVSAKVPAGLPDAEAGVQLTYDAPLQAGHGSSDADYTQQLISRTTYVDGVSLKAGKRSGGEVRVSGRVIPARAGAKVTFVTRPVSAKVFVDSVFGMSDSVFTPKKGLTTVGSTRTTKGGKFSAVVSVNAKVALAARTSGAHAGASCGVFIDRDRTPVSAP